MEKVITTMQSRGSLISRMKENTLFKGLPSEVYQYLADLSEVWAYAPNEVIVEHNEASHTYYLIVEGQARVSLEGGQKIATLGPADGFGEIGILLDTPRTATVSAMSPVKVMCVLHTQFFQCFKRFPEFGKLLSTLLARRLSDTLTQVLSLASETETPAAEVVNLLPQSFMQRLRVLPLLMEDNRLTVGFVDDPQPEIVDRIQQFLPSMELNVCSITSAYFNQVLQSISGLGDDVESDSESEENVVDGTMPTKLRTLLERMVSEGASDLHLSARRRPHWRIDGIMKSMQDVSKSGIHEVYDLLKPVMRPQSIEDFEKRNETDFAIALEHHARFRVNIFQDNNGASAVLRLIPSRILTVGQLGLPPVVLELAQQPKGLVLVTGATGSGKSTTLAAMVDYLNRTEPIHIITLEDPIEFVHPSHRALVNQREVGTHTDNFKAALRSALRQDPDVVLVGELRDQETVQLALEVANTGHLVFGTLHTMNAISSVDRIIDIFPAGQQNQIRSSLAEVLRGVISQTLCKKKSGGRVAAMEVLVASQAVTGQIRRGQTNQLETAMQTGKGLGNQLLRESLADLVRRNVITYEEGLKKSIDKVQFAKIIGRS
jgi:twitching motility protein PilT